MSAADPVRIGIIGCGNVLGAYRAAIDPLRLRGLAEVVAACGRPAQRESALAELGIERFTTDHRELIASPDVDLVLILTSMRAHGRLVREALEAGKHVLVEKPLATDLAEAADLVALARRSRGLLACAPFTVLSPTFAAISRRIRGGDIGRPCLARARYGWSGPWWSEWFYKPGGGCLLDLGVYSITTLTGLLGPARRVMALTTVAIPQREVGGRKVHVEAEDSAQVLFELAGGASAVVTTGFTMQQYRSPALEVYGTEGVIQLLGDDWDPDGYELWQNSAGAWHLFKETHPDWPWTDGLRRLVEAIRGGPPLLATAEHAYHVLEVILKAQESSREGRRLSIESSFAPPVFEAEAASEPAHLVHDRSRERLDLPAPPAAAGEPR